jgi:hypothetical protein
LAVIYLLHIDTVSIHPQLKFPIEFTDQPPMG